MKRIPITSHFVPGEGERDDDPRGPCGRYETCVLAYRGDKDAHCRDKDPIPPEDIPDGKKWTGCRFWEPAESLHAVDYMAAGGSAGSNEDAERKPHHPPPKDPSKRRPVRSARRAA